MPFKRLILASAMIVGFSHATLAEGVIVTP
jgi:hypothetical protein